MFNPILDNLVNEEVAEQILEDGGLELVTEIQGIVYSSEDGNEVLSDLTEFLQDRYYGIYTPASWEDVANYIGSSMNHPESPCEF